LIPEKEPLYLIFMKFIPLFIKYLQALAKKLKNIFKIAGYLLHTLVLRPYQKQNPYKKQP